MTQGMRRFVIGACAVVAAAGWGGTRKRADWPPKAPLLSPNEIAV